ncbi:putative membrane-associated kinase regulator 2 [Iris pallida]|uniref:Membrane-associated kinase regulator 2 n=1 Tax=Iris pallida TaxID=29817 RepID=A0AAX6I6V5_IRIPA|nr:putative membrane-associated kinase regulator 2 [Iris pallida]
MDSFSLLKYWRASTGTTLVAITTAGRELLLPSSTNATATVANEATTEEEAEDGSFFDLELSSVVTLNEQDESDSTRRLDDFTSVVSLDAAALHHSPPAPGSRLKSATRFRVFALGLNKKLKSDTGATVDSPKSSGGGGGGSNNFFVEVFTGSRNNSSKSKEDQDSAEEKRFSKEVVHKYINSKIKPLYVRVCRRYGERFSAPLAAAAAAGGDPTGKKKKKVVMVKSRSAVAAVTMPPPAAAVQRRDDSLLQQEDGIQSAIAHCKKSFNASSKGALFLFYFLFFFQRLIFVFFFSHFSDGDFGGGRRRRKNEKNGVILLLFFYIYSIISMQNIVLVVVKEWSNILHFAPKSNPFVILEDCNVCIKINFFYG